MSSSLVGHVRKKRQIGPKLPVKPDEWFEGQRLFVVLELASLETAKTKHGYQLLNSEEHASLLSKHKRDVKMYRPDILHQALLTLLDSPLNKAGKLKVFIHTQRNVLIDVNPRIRIPRTYNRFAGLMVQLLYQKRIRAVNSNEKLLKIIKNPVSKYLPPGAPIIGTSHKGELVDIYDFMNNLTNSYNSNSNKKKININNNNNSSSNIKILKKNSPIVFVFGAQPHGYVETNYVETNISISQYALSSNAAIAKVIGAVEKAWDIL